MNRPAPQRPVILIIGPTPPPYNGMSVATSTVLEVLAERFTLLHLDTADRRPLANVGRLDFRNVWLALRHGLRFLRLLVRGWPDAVYVPIAQASLGFLRDACFLVPCRLLGTPTVIHLHGGHFREFYARAPAPLRVLIRFCLGQVAQAIVLGESLRGMFDGILPRDRISVVPNGVEDFCGRFTERPGPAPAPRIVFLSTLAESKGVLDVLEAVPLVREHFPHATFLFVGEWADRETEIQVRHIIHRLSLGRSVTLRSAQGPPEKRRILSNSHIFTLPSYDEGQPLAILEAMCASLPVLTSAAGCIAETVIHGANGLILPARNPAALAAGIVRVLQNPGLYRQMAMASRELYERHFTSERFGESLSQVLERACGLPEQRSPKPRDGFSGQAEDTAAPRPSGQRRQGSGA